jgi:hypothetical protein
MVVNQIHINGICAFEAPNEPPVCADGYRPEAAQITSQGMYPEPGKVHFLRRGRHIQPSQDVFNLLEHIRPDLRRFAALIQALQTAMSKARYHIERSPVALRMSTKSGKGRLTAGDQTILIEGR